MGTPAHTGSDFTTSGQLQQILSLLNLPTVQVEFNFLENSHIPYL
jgi:hypothetical protein